MYSTIPFQLDHAYIIAKTQFSLNSQYVIIQNHVFASSSERYEKFSKVQGYPAIIVCKTIRFPSLDCGSG
jgi:hypothetical protein